MDRTDILQAVNNRKFVRNGFLTFIVSFGYYFPSAYAALLQAGLDQRLVDIHTKTGLVSLINSLTWE